MIPEMAISFMIFQEISKNSADKIILKLIIICRKNTCLSKTANIILIICKVRILVSKLQINLLSKEISLFYEQTNNCLI